MAMAAPTVPRATFSQVIVASGHMVDRPDRPVTRFPARAEPNVAEAVGLVLRSWDVGEDTLVISGGARGADIIVAESAIDLGATVWLLLALPVDEFVEASVRLPGTDWDARFLALRRRCPTWIQADVLGPPPNGEGPASVFARNNAWCLEAGRAQGPPAGCGRWSSGTVSPPTVRAGPAISWRWPLQAGSTSRSSGRSRTEPGAAAERICNAIRRV